jgi:3-oxoadipate enol-lactonase
MADDVMSLLHYLDLPAAHFVGSSFGGCIVQTIAKRYPGRVKSMVLVCSFLKPSMRLVQYGTLRLEMIDAGMPGPLVARFLALAGLSNSYMDIPGTVDRVIAAGPYPIGRIGLKNQLDAMLGFDSRGWIGDIGCPALLIGAQDDILVDLSDLHCMASVVKDSKMYCMQRVGHVPMLEVPADFNAALLEFFASQNP